MMSVIKGVQYIDAGQTLRVQTPATHAALTL